MSLEKVSSFLDLIKSLGGAEEALKVVGELYAHDDARKIQDSQNKDLLRKKNEEFRKKRDKELLRGITAQFKANSHNLLEQLAPWALLALDEQVHSLYPHWQMAPALSITRRNQVFHSGEGRPAKWLDTLSSVEGFTPDLVETKNAAAFRVLYGLRTETMTAAEIVKGLTITRDRIVGPLESVSLGSVNGENDSVDSILQRGIASTPESACGYAEQLEQLMKKGQEGVGHLSAEEFEAAVNALSEFEDDADLAVKVALIDSAYHQCQIAGTQLHRLLDEKVARNIHTLFSQESRIKYVIPASLGILTSFKGKAASLTASNNEKVAKETNDLLGLLQDNNEANDALFSPKVVAIAVIVFGLDNILRSRDILIAALRASLRSTILV